MNDCEKYLDMMSSMVDNELEESDASELMAHICACPDCRKVYAAFSAMSKGLEDMVPVPDGFHKVVMDKITAPKKTPYLKNYKRYLAAAACLALICAAGFKTGLFENYFLESPMGTVNAIGSETASFDKQSILSDNSASAPSAAPKQTASSQKTGNTSTETSASQPPLFAAAQTPSVFTEEMAGAAEGSSGEDNESLLSVNNTVKSNENRKSLGFAEEPDSTPVITINDEKLVTELLSYLEYGEEAHKPDSSPYIYIELADSSVITLWDDQENITCELGGVVFHPSGEAEKIRTFIEKLL